MLVPVRNALLVLLGLLVVAGCGDGGGKIEPDAKGGSPILHHEKAAPPPAAK